MNAKRFFFVSAVLLIAVICITVMNFNYDRLSRYPYQDQHAREIINSTFSDQDIAYLIEYSIAPSEFIDFAGYEGFSVYHASEYNMVKNSIWYFDNETIVKIVELTREYITTEELVDLLLKYDGVTILNYFSQLQDSESVLVRNPDETNAYVDDEHTVFTRILFDTLPLVSIPSSQDTIVVSSALIEPIKNMCMALESELDNQKICGGLIADSGYVSYDEQAVLFEQAQELYGDDVFLYAEAAGHSEHQLGFALDFSVHGVKKDKFKDTLQYEWLKNNAHRFGFVQSYQKEKENLTGKLDRPWHWRYVGYDLAAKMYYDNLSLIEVLK